MPKISNIDNEGIITINFPIKIKVVSETLFGQVESDLKFTIDQT